MKRLCYHFFFLQMRTTYTLVVRTHLPRRLVFTYRNVYLRKLLYTKFFYNCASHERITSCLIKSDKNPLVYLFRFFFIIL